MKEFLRGSVTRQDWIAVGGILGATALLCVLFRFFLFADMSTEINRIDDADAALVIKLNTAKALSKNIDKLRAETSKIQQLVDVFEKRLPASAEIPKMLIEFQRIAREIGIQIELTTLPPIETTRKQELPYSIVAKGTFHQIADFINRLERYERYVKISKLDIGEEKEGISTAKFTLSTYRFINVVAGTPSSAPSPAAKPQTDAKGAKS